MRRLIAIILVSMLFVPGIVFGKMKKDSKPKHQLKTIFMKDLQEPVKGDVKDAALKSVEDLMKPKGVRFKKDTNKVTGFRLKHKKVKEDRLGHKHIRLLQYYNGLPVIGGELIVHVNEKNVIHRINGKYLSAIDMPIEPTIDKNTALQTGLKAHQQKLELRVAKEPSLVIYDSHLAWHFVISYEGPELGRWWYYVDAHTGEIILRYNNIQNCIPTGSGDPATIAGELLDGEGGGSVEIPGWYDDDGNYYLCSYADNWGVYDKANDCWEFNNSPDWGASDRAAISAAYNLSLTQEWVEDVLERCSFDDTNCPFACAKIHVIWDSPLGSTSNNAQWDPENNVLLFGDGDGIVRDPFTTLDIVAHEYGHAITTYTSNLQYYSESGSLNESYSDIMAAAVEFHYQNDGRLSYPSSMPGHSDWLCGEDVTLDKAAMRDMRDPNRFCQPSYYCGTNWSSDPTDGGGVHINCGVQNFAFYLLAEGGTGVNDGYPYDLVGIGIENAVEVAMRANIEYLTSRDIFFDSRNAWIAAADDLGLSTSTVEAVWDAVGVFAHECDYDEEIQEGSGFLGGGTAQGWWINDCWNYELAFDFPFYDTNYTSVWVSTYGYLEFSQNKPLGDYSNSIEELSRNKRIAPFWTWLGAAYPNYDIYIHQPTDDSVCFRWHVKYLRVLRTEVNFEVILYEDGRIQFNYGECAVNLDEQPPTIGISAGNGFQYCLSIYNQSTSLNNVDSVLFTPISDLVPIVQEIPLNEGWNLISFQMGKCFYQGTEPTVFIPDGTEMVNIDSLQAWLSDDLRSPIRDAADPSKAGNWQRITSFDVKGTHIVEKDIPDFCNTLKYFSVGYGYRILMNAPGKLIFEGHPLPADTPLELRYGWNLIGPISIDTCYGDVDKGAVCPYSTATYKPEEAVQYAPVNTVASVFSSIDGEYRKVIKSSDSCSGETIFDTQAPYSDNTLHYIGPKYGYWVKIDNPEGGTLVFPDPVVDFQKIPLNEGWNLISFQVGKCFYQGTEPSVFIPAGTEKVNIASLKAWLSDDLTSPLRDAADPSKAGNWQRIISFDIGGGRVLEKGLPDRYDTLKYLSVGYGYWIMMNSPGYLMLEGEPLPPDTPLELRYGWNLIGTIRIDACYADIDKGSVCPYGTGVYQPEEVIRYSPVNTVASVFSSIGGEYRTIIQSSDSCSGDTTFDTQAPYSDNTLHYIGPKYGYWVKVGNPEGGTLVFPDPVVNFQKIPLNEGWNLISFQVAKCFYQGTEPTVFIPAGTEKISITSLQSWLSDDLTSPMRDAADPSKAANWQRIRAFDEQFAHVLENYIPDFANTLKYLSVGYGYHILMNAPGYLILEGKALPSDTPLELHDGWNLIGPISINTCYGDIDQGSICPYTTGIYKPEEVVQYCPVNSVSSVFSGIDGQYGRITSLDSCSGETIFDVLYPPSDNTLHYIGPKYGYWINVDNPGGCTLVFPGGCPGI